MGNGSGLPEESAVDRSNIPPLPASHQAPAGQKPLRVHVIEGDNAFGRDVARALEARGMVARAVIGGQAGIDEVLLDPPDLIVLCADLPDVSGYTVCSRLKRTRESAAIPIILTSARPDTSAFQSHQKLWVRAEAYLRKPFDVAALADLLRKLAPLVAERRALAAAAEPVHDDGEVLEDGFEYVGGGDDEAEAGSGAPMAGPPAVAASEDEVIDDGIVRVVVEAPAAAAAAGTPALEDEDVRVELPVRAPAPAVASGSPTPAPAPARAAAAPPPPAPARAAAPAASRTAPPPFPAAAAPAAAPAGSAPAHAAAAERVPGDDEVLDRYGVGRASRTAPGRWKLPAGIGAAA
jgi:ParB family chromosome partitioning protein